MKTLSIITICLNAEREIEKTLDAILLQKSAEVEYIVVDGGSVDNTLNLIRNRGSAIDKVLTGMQGISLAMNAGINASTGEWIGFIHAGDLPAENMIKEVLKVAQHQNIGVICGMQAFGDYQGPHYLIDSVPDLLHKEMTVNHIGSFVHRSVYAQCGMYNATFRFAMDYECYLRFKLRGVNFMRTNQLLAHMSAGGVSDKNWFAALKEIKRAKLLNGIPVMAANFDHFRLVSRMFARKLLEHIGLNVIVSLYRKHFARIKKI